MDKKSLPTVNLGVTLFFSALGAFLLGAMLCIWYLATLPIARVDRAPAPSQQQPLARFFVHGSDMGGAQWRSKIARMMDVDISPRSVAFTEGDLNLFIKQSMQRAQSRSDELRVMPNIEISQDSLGLSLIIYFSGKDAPVIFQTRGAIEQGQEGFFYRVNQAYLGALALPAGVGQATANMMLNRIFSAPEAIGLKQIWEALTHAEVVGSLLRLSW